MSERGMYLERLWSKVEGHGRRAVEDASGGRLHGLLEVRGRGRDDVDLPKQGTHATGLSC